MSAHDPLTRIQEPQEDVKDIKPNIYDYCEFPMLNGVGKLFDCITEESVNAYLTLGDDLLENVDKSPITPVDEEEVQLPPLPPVITTRTFDLKEKCEDTSTGETTKAPIVVKTENTETSQATIRVLTKKLNLTNNIYRWKMCGKLSSQEKKDCELFPDIRIIRERLSLLGDELFNYDELEELMDFFIAWMMPYISKCKNCPNMANRLKKYVLQFLCYFKWYRDVVQSITKQPYVGYTFYEHKMNRILAMLYDLEFRASKRVKSPVAAVVAERMFAAHSTFIGYSKDGMETLMYSEEFISGKHLAICRILLKKFASAELYFSDFFYMKYVLAFKLWCNMEKKDENRNRVFTCAIKALICDLHQYAVVRSHRILPNVDKEIQNCIKAKQKPNVTSLILNALFDPRIGFRNLRTYLERLRRITYNHHIESKHMNELRAPLLPVSSQKAVPTKTSPQPEPTEPSTGEFVLPTPPPPPATASPSPSKSPTLAPKTTSPVHVAPSATEEIPSVTNPTDSITETNTTPEVTPSEMGLLQTDDNGNYLHSLKHVLTHLAELPDEPKVVLGIIDTDKLKKEKESSPVKPSTPVVDLLSDDDDEQVIVIEPQVVATIDLDQTIKQKVEAAVHIDTIDLLDDDVKVKTIATNLCDDKDSKSNVQESVRKSRLQRRRRKDRNRNVEKVEAVICLDEDVEIKVDETTVEKMKQEETTKQKEKPKIDDDVVILDSDDEIEVECQVSAEPNKNIGTPCQKGDAHKQVPSPIPLPICKSEESLLVKEERVLSPCIEIEDDEVKEERVLSPCIEIVHDEVKEERVLSPCIEIEHDEVKEERILSPCIEIEDDEPMQSPIPLELQELQELQEIQEVQEVSAVPVQENIEQEEMKEYIIKLPYSASNSNRTSQNTVESFPPTTLEVEDVVSIANEKLPQLMVPMLYHIPESVVQHEEETSGRSSRASEKSSSSETKLQQDVRPESVLKCPSPQLSSERNALSRSTTPQTNISISPQNEERMKIMLENELRRRSLEKANTLSSSKSDERIVYDVQQRRTSQRDGIAVEDERTNLMYEKELRRSQDAQRAARSSEERINEYELESQRRWSGGLEYVNNKLNANRQTRTHSSENRRTQGERCRNNAPFEVYNRREVSPLVAQRLQDTYYQHMIEGQDYNRPTHDTVYGNAEAGQEYVENLFPYLSLFGESVGPNLLMRSESTGTGSIGSEAGRTDNTPPEVFPINIADTAASLVEEDGVFRIPLPMYKLHESTLMVDQDRYTLQMAYRKECCNDGELVPVPELGYDKLRRCPCMYCDGNNVLLEKNQEELLKYFARKRMLHTKHEHTTESMAGSPGSSWMSDGSYQQQHHRERATYMDPSTMSIAGASGHHDAMQRTSTSNASYRTSPMNANQEMYTQYHQQEERAMQYNTYMQNRATGGQMQQQYRLPAGMYECSIQPESMTQQVMYPMQHTGRSDTTYVFQDVSREESLHVQQTESAYVPYEEGEQTVIVTQHDDNRLPYDLSQRDERTIPPFPSQSEHQLNYYDLPPPPPPPPQPTRQIEQTQQPPEIHYQQATTTTQCYEPIQHQLPVVPNVSTTVKPIRNANQVLPLKKRQRTWGSDEDPPAKRVEEPMPPPAKKQSPDSLPITIRLKKCEKDIYTIDKSTQRPMDVDQVYEKPPKDQDGKRRKSKGKNGRSSKQETGSRRSTRVARK